MPVPSFEVNQIRIFCVFITEVKLYTEFKFLEEEVCSEKV